MGYHRQLQIAFLPSHNNNIGDGNNNLYSHYLEALPVVSECKIRMLRGGGHGACAPIILLGSMPPKIGRLVTFLLTLAVGASNHTSTRPGQAWSSTNLVTVLDPLCSWLRRGTPLPIAVPIDVFGIRF